MTDREPVSKKRPQFSLWFLLFVIPTIAGVILGVYSALAAQERRYRERMAEEALLITQCAQAEVRKERLAIVEVALEHLINEKSTPESVWSEIKMRPISADLSEPDTIYFFLQASDTQLRDLVDLLTEHFPDSDPATQARILICFRSIPAHVDAERLKGLQAQVRRFVEPLQRDADNRIQQLATETLHAFNSPSPLREEN